MSSRLRFLRFRFIVSLGVIALMLPAVAVMATAGTWTQVGGDIDGEASTDLSGWSVAMSGDGNTVAIGALDNDGNGLSSGHVRVYELVAGTWTQVGGDIDGETIFDQSGRRVAMSSDGNTVAIGAMGNDGNGSLSGHVRVFELVAGAWTQVGGDIDGEAPIDLSSFSVAMSGDGDTVAIGAIGNDGNGTNSGHVRVYELVAGTWTQVGADIDGEAAGDGSGRWVAMSSSGDTVAIGASLNDGNGTNSGHVRVFELVAGTWTQVGGDIDGEASADLSGFSVAMSSDGDTVAIGAINNNGNGFSSGHVRVYELVAGAWTQVGGDIDGEAIGDQSGSSLAMSSDGDTVAIGAIGNDGNGSDSGHVRVYELVAGTWTPVGGDIDGEAAGDWSGYSVAMSSDGSTVAIGAILNDGNGDRSGHVRVYSLRSQNEPPIVDAGGPYNGDEGSAIALSGATATDPDSDPLTLSWAVDAPLVCSFSDDTALNPDLTCDDDGTYTVTLTADDGTAAPVSDDATVTVDNVAPTATFGDDGPVDEGTSFNLSLTSPEDPSGADTTAGFTYAFDCGDGGGLGAFSASSTAVCTTDDNGVRNVKGQIKDKDGDSTEYTDTVTVHNVAPTADSITVPTAPVDVGAQGGATVDVVFSDPAGVNDEDYTCEFDMDFDGVSVTVDQTETGVAYNTCSTTLNYAEPGVYTVKVIVTDKDGDSGMAAATEFIVIYDPDGGFVTGGGWIDSPAGAYVADPTLTGKANFGFVSKYKKGASVPTGSTEFQFKAGDLNFHSGSYDWLVIAGQDKAKYKGTGTINGTGNYGFMLTAVDNGNSGDTFRIKIWDKDNGDAVVYDNKSNSGDDDYDGTVISGGNIKVHT